MALEDADIRQEHERGLAAFLDRSQARRITALLAKPSGPAKVMRDVIPSLRLDPRRSLRVPPALQGPQSVLEILRSAGAGPICYVMQSTHAAGSFEPLAEALAEIVGSAYGAFVSCMPGTLGYYESEAAGERYILAQAPNRLSFPR